MWPGRPATCTRPSCVRGPACKRPSPCAARLCRRSPLSRLVTASRPAARLSSAVSLCGLPVVRTHLTGRGPVRCWSSDDRLAPVCAPVRGATPYPAVLTAPIPGRAGGVVGRALGTRAARTADRRPRASRGECPCRGARRVSPRRASSGGAARPRGTAQPTGGFDHDRPRRRGRRCFGAERGGLAPHGTTSDRGLAEGSPARSRRHPAPRSGRRSQRRRMQAANRRLQPTTRTDADTRHRGMRSQHRALPNHDRPGHRPPRDAQSPTTAAEPITTLAWQSTIARSPRTAPGPMTTEP